MDEEWRPVVGWEGLYEVSSLGRVRGVTRKDSQGRTVLGKLKGIAPSGTGYPTVSLWRSGKDTTRTVHSLVAESFLGPRPEGFDVAHRDGTRTNNRVSNLRYLSRSENLREAVEHGTTWQVRTTHCPQGHPYSGSNLKIGKSPNGRPTRNCRACTQERSNAHGKRPFDKNRADAIYLKRLRERGE